jgi:hypothetical protein
MNAFQDALNLRINCAMLKLGLHSSKWAAENAQLAVEKNATLYGLNYEEAMTCPLLCSEHLTHDFITLGAKHRAALLVREQIGLDWMKAQVDALAKAAMSGSGQVYELFHERFCDAMDAFLTKLTPELHRFAIDATGGEYNTPEERTTARQEQAAHEAQMRAEGRYVTPTCIHHLDPMCCPVGCGDIDD